MNANFMFKTAYLNVVMCAARLNVHGENVSRSWLVLQAAVQSYNVFDR